MGDSVSTIGPGSVVSREPALSRHKREAAASPFRVMGLRIYLRGSGVARTVAGCRYARRIRSRWTPLNPTSPYRTRSKLSDSSWLPYGFDTRGKDWLTVDEAAHYCGVSSRQFRRNAPELGLVPRNFMGKQLYEKNELYKAIENSGNWKSRGTAGASLIPTSPQMEEALARLRRYDQRRGKG